jgi:hypothetical protein
MFLLLVGTILAVGYSYPRTSAENPVSRMSFEYLAFVRSQTNSLQNSSSNGTSYSSESQTMQNHLCQILAHYVVYIGSKLNLPIANDADRFILEAAPKRWHKEGIFRWLTPTAHGQQHEDILPKDIDAKCNDGTLCARSKTNCIFTLNRVEFQNAIAHEPSFFNSVDGSSRYDILEISNPALTFGQSNFSSLTNQSQPSRSSETSNDSLVASLSNPFDLSPESTHPGNATKRLWNTSSQIGYQPFSFPKDRCDYKPLPASRNYFEGVQLCELSNVKGCRFATLGACSGRGRAGLEETQNLLL